MTIDVSSKGNQPHGDHGAESVGRQDPGRYLVICSEFFRTESEAYVFVDAARRAHILVDVAEHGMQLNVDDDGHARLMRAELMQAVFALALGQIPGRVEVRCRSCRTTIEDCQGGTRQAL